MALHVRTTSLAAQQGHREDPAERNEPQCFLASGDGGGRRRRASPARVSWGSSSFARLVGWLPDVLPGDLLEGPVGLEPDGGVLVLHPIDQDMVDPRVLRLEGADPLDGGDPAVLEWLGVHDPGEGHGILGLPDLPQCPDRPPP